MIVLETCVYTLQIASFFFLAGPILIRSERQRTLARNPAWVAGHPEFLARHGKADVQASVAFGLILLPGWALAALGLGMAASLGLNAWGWLSGSMAPARALGNAVFLGLFAAGMGLAIRYIVGRPSLRLSEGTDSAGRSLELSLALGTCCFLIAVSLYHTLGSLGPDPLFAFPPTLIHARIEGQAWSWSVFFARPEYRWVEIAASLVLAWVGPWLAISPFNRRLLTVDMRRVRSAAEV